MNKSYQRKRSNTKHVQRNVISDVKVQDIKVKIPQNFSKSIEVIYTKSNKHKYISINIIRVSEYEKYKVTMKYYLY